MKYGLTDKEAKKVIEMNIQLKIPFPNYSYDEMDNGYWNYRIIKREQSSVRSYLWYI